MKNKKSGALLSSFAKRVLEYFFLPAKSRTIFGDLEEFHEHFHEKRGRIYADFWYTMQLVIIIFGQIFNIFYWSKIMILNYLKIAFRNLFKHKAFSIINISGLSVGIACSILITLFVNDELSYDRFHANADNIYRVAVRAQIGSTKIAQAYTPAILPRTLMQDYPEVIQATTMARRSRTPIKYEEKVYIENRIFLADSAFFNVFSFPFIEGDPKTALSLPNTVVLTESTAKRYFGDEDPIGKVISTSNSKFKVTGVVTDVPANSHFHFDMVYSVITDGSYRSTNWYANNYKTYIVLQDGYDFRQMDEKLPEFVKKHMNSDRQMASGGNFWEYYLQPLTDIHLNSELSGELEANGNKTYVYMFSIIAIIILLIACINFMNLTTAKSTDRAKEIGIRKVVGSHKGQLIKQFLIESVLLSFVSVVFALIIFELILPAYNSFIGKELSLAYSDPIVLSTLFGIALGVGILSGIYPAFFLSSFKPVSIIKGNSTGHSGNALFRNALVIFQFSISIFLIIGTIVVDQQLSFLQNNKLGFDKEQVVVVKNLRALGDNKELFKEQLLQNASITNASISHTLPGNGHNNWGMKPENQANITLFVCIADDDFADTMKLEMVKGRYFSKEFPSDSTSLIINESAAKLLEWDDPIGKVFNVWGNSARKKTVIGVVKDYHYESMRQKVRPMTLIHTSSGLTNPNYLSVRVNTSNISETLNFIEESWANVSAGLPYEFSFLNEDYNNLYQNEMQTGTIFKIFSLLAIFIASLGLFGLSSYIAGKRTKEIGIRKVLGASFSELITSLSKEFIALILISNIFSWSAGWYMMNTWLEQFAFKIEIGVGIFLISGLIGFLILVFTISFQTVKIARTNPIESLRYE